MKKISVTPGVAHTNAQLQEKEYLVLSEKRAGAFVVRYFKICSKELIDGETLNDTLEVFDPTSTPLMRQLVNEHKFYKGSAVTADPKYADCGMREIGRHIFRPEIGAASVVGTAEKYDFPLYVLPFAGVDSIGEPYNHFIESAQVKGPVHRNGRMKGNKAVFLLYATKSNEPIDNWTVCRIETSAFEFDDRTDGNWVSVENFSPMQLLPVITLNSPASMDENASAEVEVAMTQNGSALNYSGELVIEMVNGYAPKSRISITNGLGSFKVMSLGLDSGDVLRAKVGTRLVSGMAEAQISVR